MADRQKQQTHHKLYRIQVMFLLLQQLWSVQSDLCKGIMPVQHIMHNNRPFEVYLLRWNTLELVRASIKLPVRYGKRVKVNISRQMSMT